MDFSAIKSITIPEGNVVQIDAGGVTLWKSGPLPSAYQQVEWIRVEKNIGAYINLGFAFDTSATVHLGMYATSGVTSYIFGATENSGKVRCILSNPYGSEGQLYGTGSNGYIQCVAHYVAGWNDYILTFKKGLLKCENITSAKSYSATTQASPVMTANLYLFAQNYNGSARFGNVRQVRSFQYYDKNNDLICDLIPCYRKSDGVIGMYDIVRKIFLTNAGSGSFTKGADV